MTRARRFAVNGAVLLGTLLSVASAAWAQPGGASRPPPPGKALTDPQIAEIAVVANQLDVDAARLVPTRSHNKDVKAFAQTMVRDHESVIKQAKALVEKLKVKPEPSATSKKLEADGKKSMASLKKLKGVAFDKAYINQEVAYHQQVLSVINSTLIPSAQNPELKDLLQKTAPVIQAHLEHAKMLQQQLASGGASGKSPTHR